MSVLVTWLFATLAWGYFFSTVVDDEMVITGLAFFFGFAILSIDRSLITAMSGSGRRKFLPVAFRLLLAFTIGLFISQPVILLLFRKDIQAQMVLNRQGKLEKFRNELATLNEAHTTALQNDLQQWEQQLQQKTVQVKAYKDDYIKETDGTGGSGKIGESSIARVKKTEYLKAEQELTNLRRQLEPQLQERRAQLAGQWKENLAKEKVYMTSLTDGFLAQTEALEELTAEHAPLRQRYRLIVLIITLIEVMPLLSKLLMPKGEYDKLVEHNNMYLGYRKNNVV
jgi:DNA repair exonuclease SbcCD ATPase subunit